MTEFINSNGKATKGGGETDPFYQNQDGGLDTPVANVSQLNNEDDYQLSQLQLSNSMGKSDNDMS